MSREPQQTEMLNGRIDGPKVHELARHIDEIATADEYFVCGPGTMVEEVRGALKEINADAPVRIERFATSAGPVTPTVAGQVRAPARELLATITITLDGRRRSFAMSPEDGSVLEAAERAGLELPFSCRSGICATCRARVVEGAAVMTHNIALAPWEIEAGFVLCCQARPTTSRLELSYDDK
jgi:ring-1,2-phenylacetyl-CoA epoxidase subunit PaaE